MRTRTREDILQGISDAIDYDAGLFGELDDSCTMMELRLTSQESLDWLKRTLDKTFNVEIDKEVLGQAKTIGDVVDLVERMLNG